jgi:DNA repair protein RecN (Recombination protein N)
VLADAPDERLAEAGRACVQAAELVRDAASTCAAAGDRLVGDAQELARVEARRDGWYDLMRKHGDSEEAVLAAWAAIDTRIGALEGLDARREGLVAQVAAAQAERAATGDKLAKSRSKGFNALSKAVREQLSELGMPKVTMTLSQEPAGQPGPSGTVRQEFLVSTNPGLPAGPLGEVVSGGEGARISLALAVVLAEHEGTPVLVFDEVDSGVGGRLGTAIGVKLAQLGRTRTVIVVTHTPHVAAAAHRHYSVRKVQGDRTTMVAVDEIQGDQRMAELADMLGGGSAALGQAKALMAGAKR